MSYTINVDVSGPIFDERGEKILGDFTREAVWEITKVGRGDLGVRFIQKFKLPTGYYESRVEPTRPIPFGHSAFRSTIHDNKEIYGCWLEGIGSRNYPVTRFKGYHSFRVVALQLQRKAVPIAEAHLPKFLARLNGGA